MANSIDRIRIKIQRAKKHVIDLEPEVKSFFAATSLKQSGRFASVLGKPDAAQKAGITVKDVWAQPDPDRLHQLAKGVRDGRFSIPVTRRVRLSEIREAYQATEKGSDGEILLIP
ncbi:MAG: zinc-binding dehydrogenase [Acidobacteriota bacterium]|nr:zinc-binding dehydrogenase [Acidobacteriota bacterium]